MLTSDIEKAFDNIWSERVIYTHRNYDAETPNIFCNKN